MFTLLELLGDTSNFSEKKLHILELCHTAGAFITQKGKDAENISAKIKCLLQSKKTCYEGLFLLECFLHQFPPEILEEGLVVWIRAALHILSTEKTFAVRQLAWKVLEKLLSLFPEFIDQRKEASSFIVPAVMENIFKDISSTAKEPEEGAVRCLLICLQTYGKSCGSVKGALEKFLFQQLLLWNSPSVQDTVAECIAQIPNCGGGGVQGKVHAEAWVSQISRLISTIHVLLDRMFENLDLEKSKAKKEDALLFEIPPEFQYAYGEFFLCWKLILVIGKCICAMLSFNYNISIPVSVPLEDLLSVVYRILSINVVTVSSWLSQEAGVVASLIPSMQNLALTILNNLTQRCGTLLMTESLHVTEVILHLIQRQQLDLSSDSGNLKKAAYQALSLWIQTCGINSSVDLIIDKLLPCLLHDIILTTSGIQLGKDRGKQKNYSLRKHFTTFEKSGILCREALRVLRILICTYGTSMKVDFLQDIQMHIVLLLLQIQQQFRSPPPPYSSSKCRQELYAVLLALVSNHHPSCPPPLHCAIRIFMNGKQEKNAEVTEVCHQGLLCSSLSVHPDVSSLPSSRLESAYSSLRQGSPPPRYQVCSLYAVPAASQSHAFAQTDSLTPTCSASIQTDPILIPKPAFVPVTKPVSSPVLPASVSKFPLAKKRKMSPPEDVINSEDSCHSVEDEEEIEKKPRSRVPYHVSRKEMTNENMMNSDGDYSSIEDEEMEEEEEEEEEDGDEEDYEDDDEYDECAEYSSELNANNLSRDEASVDDEELKLIAMCNENSDNESKEDGGVNEDKPKITIICNEISEEEEISEVVEAEIGNPVLLNHHDKKVDDKAKETNVPSEVVETVEDVCIAASGEMEVEECSIVIGTVNSEQEIVHDQMENSEGEKRAEVSEIDAGVVAEEGSVTEKVKSQVIECEEVKSHVIECEEVKSEVIECEKSEETSGEKIAETSHSVDKNESMQSENIHNEEPSLKNAENESIEKPTSDLKNSESCQEKEISDLTMAKAENKVGNCQEKSPPVLSPMNERGVPDDIVRKPVETIDETVSDSLEKNEECCMVLEEVRRPIPALSEEFCEKPNLKASVADGEDLSSGDVHNAAKECNSVPGKVTEADECMEVNDCCTDIKLTRVSDDKSVSEKETVSIVCKSVQENCIEEEVAECSQTDAAETNTSVEEILEDFHPD